MLTVDIRQHLNAELGRLLATQRHPEYAIAFSGGGDSTALLHAVSGHSHCKAVFIVDHGLRKGSDNEALAAQSAAQALGYDAHVLTWEPGLQSTAIQERARKARYMLMGQACRARNISNLVTAHTQNDQAETLLMRYDRGTGWRGAAGMAASVKAPLWPELSEVTLLRPALGLSRHALREYNEAHHLKFIDDPSNQNTDFARIRARHYLGTHPKLAADLITTASDLSEGRRREAAHLQAIAQAHTAIDDMGAIRVSASVPSRLLGYALQAASGQGDPINESAIAELSRRMKQSDFKGATLGGARIVPSEAGSLIVRDPGAVSGRAGQAPISSQSILKDGLHWDGRFTIKTIRPGLSAVPLASVWDSLTKAQKAKAKAIPGSMRETCPAICEGGSVLAIGTEMSHSDIAVDCTVKDHFDSLLRPRLS